MRIFMVGSLIIRSYLTGFLAACIVGPVFTLVLYRTVTQGLSAGIASAVGMATADGIFFFLAAMSGVSSGQLCFSKIKMFETVGGPLMVVFGLWTLLRKTGKPSEVSAPGRSAFAWQMFSSMFLTLANPLTILFFCAVARQVFPEMMILTLPEIIFSSVCLSMGSFSLLTVTMLVLRRQSSIDPESMMTFFKTLSGLGLLLTGCLLSFGHWASVRNWQDKEIVASSAPLSNQQ
jgi:threonine/homoserine/homoserine lactone efflux protein